MATGSARIVPNGRSSDRVGYFRLKRVVDIVAVLAVAPLALLLLAALSMLIRIDSRGRAIFKQERVRSVRVKRDGEWVWELQPFTFLKLRTMHESADASPHREYLAAYIEADDQAMAKLQPSRNGDSYKMVADPRVTRVGATLRRLSLDELPQLWNVLRGDISMVGPRPPIDYELEKYSDADYRRLGGPLGLTGHWQVSGRSECSFQEMVKLDTEYLERQSIWLDLKIMAKTVGVVVSTKGAG